MSHELLDMRLQLGGRLLLCSSGGFESGGNTLLSCFSPECVRRSTSRELERRGGIRRWYTREEYAGKYMAPMGKHLGASLEGSASSGDLGSHHLSITLSLPYAETPLTHGG